MESARVKSLLDESETLGIYVANAGKLPDNSRIFELIDSMRLALERGEQPPLAPLFAERETVADAAGITVAQLMRRETPLGRWSRRAALAASYLIGFMTLLLTLYLAFQSSELHKADLALREYQDLVSERLPDKIYLAWKMYYYEDVLNVRGPPLAQLDGYQKVVDDAKRVNVKREAVANLLMDSSVIRYVPQWFEYHGPCSLQNLARALNAPASTLPIPACPVKKVVREKESNAIEEKLASEKTITAGTHTLVVPHVPDCSKAHLPLVGDVKLTPRVSKLDLDKYVLNVECFMRSLKIINYDYPVDAVIYATRNKVQLLVSWLLPGLYGLLGACVFVMRDLLHDNVLSKVRGDARIVDVLTLLLRVALGGLAGIIIGWFSVPTALTSSSAAISISSIPFGMAFLAGFSIESLFALLDRLNKPPVQRAEKRPADTAKESERKP